MATVLDVNTATSTAHHVLGLHRTLPAAGIIALGASLAACAYAQTVPTYSVEQLLPMEFTDPIAVNVQALNELGEAVGYTDPAEALIWIDDRTDVLTSPLAFAFPQEMNDLGQVVGFAWDGGDSIRYSVVWTDGVPLHFRPLDAEFSVAEGMNNFGQVVGYYRQSSSAPLQAYLWAEGVASNLGALDGGMDTQANAIDDAGTIVGYTVLNEVGRVSWAIVESTGMIELPGLDGERRSDAFAVATVLDAFGRPTEVVVGQAWDASDGRFVPCKWTDVAASPSLVELSVPLGHAEGEGLALGVNSQGLSVGRYIPQSGEPIAALWDTAGVGYDLNGRVVLDGVEIQLHTAVAINDSGQIACRGRIGDEDRSFLLTPTRNLVLDATPLVAGEVATFTVEGADRSQRAFLFGSLSGSGHTFVPALNVVLDLAGPVQGLGARQPNQAGRALWRLRMPGVGAPLPVWFQAAQREAVSNALERVVSP